MTKKTCGNCKHFAVNSWGGSCDWEPAEGWPMFDVYEIVVEKSCTEADTDATECDTWKEKKE